MAKRTGNNTGKNTGKRQAERLTRTAKKTLSVVRKGQESAAASVEVIGKRMALGAAALSDPIAADYAELNRMIPEKITALSSTNLILGEKSALLGFRVLRHMNEEAIRATAHLGSLMTIRDPAAMVTAQTAYLAAVSQRLVQASWLFASLGVTMVDAASAPAHRTVMANAKRLR